MARRFAGFSLIAAGMLFLPSLAFAQKPSSLYTPGAKTKATDVQVCAPDYESSFKPVAGHERKEALGRYGKRDDDTTFELDHLIAVSLGGSNDPDNLWPLPKNREYGPEWKNELDKTLHQMVCDKKITLKAAQDAVKKDWTKAYDQYVKGAAK